MLPPRTPASTAEKTEAVLEALQNAASHIRLLERRRKAADLAQEAKARKLGEAQESIGKLKEEVKELQHDKQMLMDRVKHLEEMLAEYKTRGQEP